MWYVVALEDVIEDLPRRGWYGCFFYLSGRRLWWAGGRVMEYAGARVSECEDADWGRYRSLECIAADACLVKMAADQVWHAGWPSVGRGRLIRGNDGCCCVCLRILAQQLFLCD